MSQNLLTCSRSPHCAFEPTPRTWIQQGHTTKNATKNAAKNAIKNATKNAINAIKNAIDQGCGWQAIPHPERLIHHVCPKFRLKSPNFIYKSSKIVSNLSQNLTCQLQLAAVFRLLLVRAGHKDDELIRIHVELKSNSSRINSRICTWAPTPPRRICWICCAARRLRRRGPYHYRRHRAPPRPARRPRRFRTSEGRRGSARSPAALAPAPPPALPRTRPRAHSAQKNANSFSQNCPKFARIRCNSLQFATF